MAKGGAYEREVCKQLSLWASGGEYSDWFWRSSNSGGRATTRAKCGLRTHGQIGDICATHPDGEFFIKLVVPEVKRGYNTSAFFSDLIDRRVWPTGKARKRTILGFLEQAIRSKRSAGTPYWMVIHKKDHREAVVYIPDAMKQKFCPTAEPAVYAVIEVLHEWQSVCCLRFTKFLELVSPVSMAKEARRYK